MKKILFFFCCCLIAANLQAQSTTRYVKTGGTAATEAAAAISWTAACEDLQAVINVSSAGDEIWVAAGTYIPNRQATDVETITTTNRNNAFVMKAGVKIYGSFTDGDDELSDRVLSAGPTSILSGDFNGDDAAITSTTVPGTMAENAYHVVIFANDEGTASVLDGFVVKGGNANGSSNITVNTKAVTVTNGGGIYIVAASPILTNLIIQGNATVQSGSGRGAGMYISGSSPIVTNVLITKNVLVSGYQSRGIGVCNDATSSPVFTNITIAGNFGIGGGMHNYDYNSTPKIRNSIISDNGSTAGTSASGSTFTNTFLGSGEVFNSTPEGTGIITGASPSFNNAASGDYSLSESSPCINAGDKTVYGGGQTPDLSGILTDLLGAPRFYNAGEVDLGAYEFQGDPVYAYTPDVNGIVYVTEAGDGNGKGSSWDNAATNLAEVLSLATTIPNVKQIWVAKGTYKPQVIAGNGATDRDKAFVLAKNIKVYGGFAGTETALSERVLSPANASILSGDLNGDDNGDDNLSENAHHVVISAGDVGTAVLDGFTISGGNANILSNISVGGQNISRNGGAGIYIYSSSPALSNLIIIENTATGNGAGIYNGSTSSVLTNIVISGNKKTTTTGDGGGGIYNISSTSYFTNVTITGNSSATAGGGLYTWNCSPQIRNSIIYGNGSSNIHAQSSNKPKYSNSLIAGSSAGWTDLGTDEGSNIDANPLFTDAATGDFTLQTATCVSPCINAGDNTLFDGGKTPDLSAITTDLAGNARKTGTVDMGAYESSVATTYTISGKVIDTVSKNPMAGVTISYCTDAYVITDATGTYSIKVLPNADVTLTASKDGYLVITEPIECTNVAEDLTDKDFEAIVVPSTISGKVILSNGDPLAGVYIWYNNRASATVTKTDGTYEIANVLSGSSITIEPEMTDYTFTPATRTINNVTKDSANNNFTAAKMYTITGTLTLGQYSSGQRIYYTINSGSQQFATTDATGNYSITVKEDDNITITPPTGMPCVFIPDTIALENISQNYTDQDFAAMDSIKGTITFNDSPLADVTITYGDGLTTTTDSDGKYVIMTAYETAEITLTPSMDGYKFDPENIVLTNVTTHRRDQNFAASKIHTVSGTVTVDGEPMENVTITYGDQLSTTTDASGEYFVTIDNEGADITLTPSKEGYTFTPESISIEDITKDSTGNDFEATVNTYIISGTVTENNDPLADVAIVYGTDSVTTNADGEYSITVNYGADITLTPSKEGYTFTPVSLTIEDIIKDSTGNDFEATVSTYTISGTVTENNDPLADVDIVYGTDSVTTNADGEYSITVNYGANITLTPSKDGYTFTPVSLTIEDIAKDSTGNDFVGEREIVSTDDLKVGDNIRIYPNPTSSIVNIDNPDNLQISVYTIGGKLVLKTTSKVVDLSGKAKGIYIFRVGDKNFKVIKE